MTSPTWNSDEFLLTFVMAVTKQYLSLTTVNPRVPGSWRYNSILSTFLDTVGGFAAELVEMDEAAGCVNLVRACLALSFIITEQGRERGSSPMKVKEGIVRGGRGGDRLEAAAVA